MRLQQFIISEGRTKSITQEAAIDSIKKNCKLHSKSLLSGARAHIYRGIKDFSDSFGIVDPRKGRDRVSANTSNYMTLLMDNLPSWRGYPKRSKSIICSTRFSSADNYGWDGVYYVFPYDGCNIATAPEGDIWVSFNKVLSGMIDISILNDKLKNIGIDDSSWSNLKKSFKDIIENSVIKFADTIKTAPDQDTKKDIIRNIINSYAKTYGRIIPLIEDYLKSNIESYLNNGKTIDIIKYFDKELSPKNHGFKNTAPGSGDKHNEIWIGDAPIILVKYNRDIVDYLEKERLA